MKLRLFIPIVSLLFVLSACKEDLAINEEFSINLIQPGPKWPNLKKLNSAQKEVFERNGRPDHFRIFWVPSGEIRSRAELHGQMKGKKPKSMPPHSWVYLRAGKEIVFRGSNYEEIPLTDQVKVLAKYGDPEDVRQLEGGIVEWQFFGAGKLYKFGGGRIVEQKDFPAMGQFIK